MSDSDIKLLLGQIDGKLSIQGARIETLFVKVDEIASIKQEVAVMQETCRNERTSNKRRIEIEDTAKRSRITPWYVAIVTTIVYGMAELIKWVIGKL